MNRVRQPYRLLPDSNKTASVKPGAVQYTGLRDDLLPYKSRIDRRVVYKEDDVENFKKHYLFQ